MRHTLLTLLLITTAGAVHAQGQVYTPAPVPDTEVDRGAPADRAGRPDGSDSGAPFSGLPTSSTAGSGEATPNATGGPAPSNSPAPNLGR